MLSAGNGLKISCADDRDRETRRITRLVVYIAAKQDKRIFSRRSRLRSKKISIIDKFKRNQGSKELLLKLLRGVPWEKLDHGFQRKFIEKLRASGVARWIAVYNGGTRINMGHVTSVWRQVFQNRSNTPQCSVGSSGTPSSLPPSRPVAPTPTPTRPTPPVRSQPADSQIALQNALVEAVRAVYGAATSESAAKTVLKTQSWSTLKQLGIVKHIMAAFGRLGYRRASKIERVARRLLKKALLRHWKKTSGVITPQTPARPAPQPAPRPTSAPAPAPRPTPTQPSITPAQRKAYVTTALLAALKTKGLATTNAEAIAFAKGQTWSTVLALKLHIKFIETLNNDARLGKWRPRNSRNQIRAAEMLFLSLRKG
jgi:hypothetical protein